MKIWISLLAVLCFANIACAQSPEEYPDVTLNNPVYADIDVFYTSDDIPFISCYSSPLPNQRRALTRYEFAIAVARLGLFPQHEANYEAAIRSALSTKKPQELAALVRLIKEFKPELQQLGIADAQIQFAQNELDARTGSTPSAKSPIAAPFRDVPKTHWAFEAVEKLRQSGIIIGIADGAFAK